MSRELIASTQQVSEVAQLVDQLGVGAYRDAKVAADLAWHTPFSRLYRFEGGWLIGPDGTRIPTPNEKDFFDLIIGGMIPPEDRSQWQKYYGY